MKRWKGICVFVSVDQFVIESLGRLVSYNLPRPISLDVHIETSHDLRDLLYSIFIARNVKYPIIKAMSPMGVLRMSNASDIASGETG